MREKEFFELLNIVLEDIRLEIVCKINVIIDKLPDKSFKNTCNLIDIRDHVNSLNIDVITLKNKYLAYSKRKIYRKINKIKEESEQQVDKIRKKYGL